MMQVEDNFNKLKAGLIDKLVIVTGTFVEQLKARTYTKVTSQLDGANLSKGLFAPLVSVLSLFLGADEVGCWSQIN